MTYLLPTYLSIHYRECRDTRQNDTKHTTTLKIIKLITKQNILIVILIVVMLNVIMLSVMPPYRT
jgi:hypothetical protein